jgi:hypothetical protein
MDASASVCAAEVWSYFLHKEWTTYTTVVIFHTSFLYKIPSASLLLNTDQLKMTFIWVIYHIQLLLVCVREVTYLITTSSKVAWFFRCGYDATEYDEIKPAEGIDVQGEPFS